MKLAVVAVGRLKDGPERELVERYRERATALGRSLGFAPVQVIEVPESRARRAADRRAEEAAAILDKAAGSALVAFDERGRSLASDAFAQRIAGWRVASAEDLAAGGRQVLQFRFRLDSSQLPRTFQLGAVGQADWQLSIERRIDLSPEEGQ